MLTIGVDANMPRPPKFRRVEFLPQVTVFKPTGVPLRELEEEVLAVEELEAIRLKDLLGLEQEECAERMKISRPTFQRVLVSARQKIARALVEGRAIRVEGGNYKIAFRPRRCRFCDFELETFADTEERDSEIRCPRCGARHERLADEARDTSGVPRGRHGKGWRQE